MPNRCHWRPPIDNWQLTGEVGSFSLTAARGQNRATPGHFWFFFLYIYKMLVCPKREWNLVAKHTLSNTTIKHYQTRSNSTVGRCGWSDHIHCWNLSLFIIPLHKRKRTRKQDAVHSFFFSLSLVIAGRSPTRYDPENAPPVHLQEKSQKLRSASAPITRGIAERGANVKYAITQIQLDIGLPFLHHAPLR